MNLSQAERDEQMAKQRGRTMAVGQVRRARLVLLLDAGVTREAIIGELRSDSRFISRWKARFSQKKLAGCTRGIRGLHRITPTPIRPG